jgi:site-specific recombinase XerD
MISLNDFMRYLKKSRYSQDTIDTYNSLLSKFEDWLGSKNKTIDNFTQIDVDEYRRASYSASSSNTFLAAVKSYLRFRVGSLPLGAPNLLQETQRENQIRLLRAGRSPSKIRKTALTEKEVGSLLKKMQKETDPLVFAGAVLAFYFGARITEQSSEMKKARINWKKQEMIIPTLKRGEGSERFLAWHESISPFLKLWYEHLDEITYPREWLTKRLRNYKVDGLRVTCRVARHSFQTNMRIHGVDDLYIDLLLGHVSRSSAIGDIYTDFSDPAFKNKIHEIMTNQHYMVAGGIVKKEEA